MTQKQVNNIKYIGWVATIIISVILSAVTASYTFGAQNEAINKDISHLQEKAVHVVENKQTLNELEIKLSTIEVDVRWIKKYLENGRHQDSIRRR